MAPGLQTAFQLDVRCQPWLFVFHAPPTLFSATCSYYHDRCFCLFVKTTRCQPCTALSNWRLLTMSYLAFPPRLYNPRFQAYIIRQTGFSWSNQACILVSKLYEYRRMATNSFTLILIQQSSQTLISVEWPVGTTADVRQLVLRDSGRHSEPIHAVNYCLLLAIANYC